MLAALQEAMGPDAIVVTDGGDSLGFARVGPSAPAMLDPRPFGRPGVGVPYGIVAGLAFPDRPVVVATGDGSFGFNAIEVDTAVRHGAPVPIVVADNGAWQIEVHDQTSTHGKVVGTRRASPASGLHVAWRAGAVERSGNGWGTRAIPPGATGPMASSVSPDGAAVGGAGSARPAARPERARRGSTPGHRGRPLRGTSKPRPAGAKSCA